MKYIITYKKRGTRYFLDPRFSKKTSAKKYIEKIKGKYKNPRVVKVKWM